MKKGILITVLVTLLLWAGVLLWGSSMRGHFKRDTERLHEGMMKPEVQALFASYYFDAVHTNDGSGEISSATRVFQSSRCYNALQVFQKFDQHCTVFYDSNDVIVAYEYGLAD